MMEVDYNASQALLRLRESDTRRKGSQSGSVRFKSGAWYIRFNEWRFIDGAWKWAETERKVSGTDHRTSETKALLMGNAEHVSKANQLNKAPQGLSDLQTFIALQYQPTVVNGYHGQWKRTVDGILKNHIIPAFGMLALNEIKRPMVQEWVNRLAKTYSGQTVAHCVKILKAIFDYASDLYDIDDRNPADRVKLPRIDAAQRQALTMDQVRQLAAKIDSMAQVRQTKGRTFEAHPDYARLVLTLALTGMRIGEALGLRWRNVDFTEKAVYVVESFSAGEWGPTKTKSSRRKIAMTAELREILQQQLSASQWNGEEHTVFVTSKGTPLDAGNIADRYLKPAAEALKLGEVTWHTFRHTTRTLLDKFSTEAEAQAIMGHTSQAMGRRYTHVSQDAMREALERATGKPN